MAGQAKSAPQAPLDGLGLESLQIRDERDVSPRIPTSQVKGRRVRAIPARGGTTVEIGPKDFNSVGIDNPKVVWDFRKDNFTVPVGPILSEAAANWLCESFPSNFKFVDG